MNRKVMLVVPMPFKPREWVQVRSFREIAATLDDDGTLDGLPFMPEMLPFCGRQFQILRRAEKTCLEVPRGWYLIRDFKNNDVFFLDGLRCSGASHDGCQRACLLFWKSAWLEPAPAREQASEPAGETATPSRVLKTKNGQQRYFCQSTQLRDATNDRPLGKLEILRKLLREFRTGAVDARETVSLSMVPLYRKIRDRLVGRPRLRGTLQRTPVGDLGLRPGEIVEIRSVNEMRETLDAEGRNRGLPCDIELKKFCGKRYRVFGRLDRMISEATGEMREVKGTVLLEGNTCLCARVLGGCPRQEFCYWREVWLRRVEAPAQTFPNTTKEPISEIS
jgi:hypothetical protein